MLALLIPGVGMGGSSATVVPTGPDAIEVVGQFHLDGSSKSQFYTDGPALADAYLSGAVASQIK